MSFIRNSLAKLGFLERRSGQRVNVRGLRVFYSTGSEQREARIGDISQSSISLVTDERWAPGTSIVLTLEYEDLSGKASRSRAKLRARCVRLTEVGPALTFMQRDVDPAKWLEAMAKAQALIAPDDPIRVFRLAKVLTYLFRISPTAQDRILKLISDGLTNERAERVTEIALLADDLLEREDSATRVDVAPSVVLGILELGADAEEEEPQACWARLLATSSLSGSQDDKSLSFAHLLSRLDLFHLRVLRASYSRALQDGWKPGTIPSKSIDCAMEEVKAIAGVASLDRLEWVLRDLNEFGLLGATVKSDHFGRFTQVNLTPTDLALELCVRCIGQEGLLGASVEPQLSPKSSV